MAAKSSRRAVSVRPAAASASASVPAVPPRRETPARRPPVAVKNRRRHARADVPSTVILFIEHKPIGPCVVEDVSEGGLRVVTDRKLPPGRIVSVLSDLPGSEALLAFAQITRCETRGKGEQVLGLSFVDLPRAEAQRLHQIVAGALADSNPGVDFFDTEDVGNAKRLVLADGSRPMVLNGKAHLRRRES